MGRHEFEITKPLVLKYRWCNDAFDIRVRCNRLSLEGGKVLGSMLSAPVRKVRVNPKTGIFQIYAGRKTLIYKADWDILKK